jgi:Domain of Unknown Function (DUF928)
MTGRRVFFACVAAALTTTAGLPLPAVAQTSQGESASQPSESASHPSAPVYRPPLRGAPGERVSGASRGTFKVAVPLPTIELLAPKDHTGLTVSPTPSLFFFVSGPIIWPARFTISAPGRPDPLLDVPIAAPTAAGIHRLDVADYRVRLDPGVVYTWSVSAILDPQIRARDIVASANVMLSAPAGDVGCALNGASPVRRAGLCAQEGLWYDAVAAAVTAEPYDRHVALDALMNEVGLAEAAAYDRPMAAAPSTQ